jgi:peptidoglycan-associated lipoprotein
MRPSPVRILLSLAVLAMLTAACAKKKVAEATPPPPQPAASPAPATRPSPPPARAAATPAPTATTPASRYPSAATRARIDQLLARIEDAYFDYDRASLRADAMEALQDDSTELRNILKDYPDYTLSIEGHCDERGSAEYNLALGDQRAQAARDYLVQIGIPAAQFKLVSYGKERPVCQEHDEACWQKNRRIHFVALAQAQ